MTPTPESSSAPATISENAEESAKASTSLECSSSGQELTSSGFWRVFLSTFGTIFLAEVGDKTQLATLLMSAESGKPWVVFLGSGTALILTSLLGVALGQWISRHVSPRTLDTFAGIVLLAITVCLLWDVVAL